MYGRTRGSSDCGCHRPVGIESVDVFIDGRQLLLHDEGIPRLSESVQRYPGLGVSLRRNDAVQRDIEEQELASGSEPSKQRVMFVHQYIVQQRMLLVVYSVQRQNVARVLCYVCSSRQLKCLPL